MSYRALTLCALTLAPSLHHASTPSPQTVRVVRSKRGRRRRESFASVAVTRPSQASGSVCAALRLVMEDYHPCQP